MKNLTEKLKDLGVSDSDLLSISESYQEKLDEQLALKLDEEKKKLELSFEESFKTKLEEALKESEETLEETYSKKLEDFQNEMLEQLDAFLESEINENISEDLIDKAGINEATEPLIKDIMKLFETKYVALDVEGTTLLKAKSELVEAKDLELSEVISEKLVLKEELSKIKKDKLILEKTMNLSEVQKKRVNDLFEGRDFKFVEEKIGSFVSMIVEEKQKIDSKVVINENKDAITSDDKIPKTVVVTGKKSLVEEYGF